MSLFTSSKEKHLWIWVFVVFTTIFSTLIIGQPLTTLFSNQNVQAAIFVLGMLLVGATIIVHSIKRKPSKIEITILLGIVSVYTMFFLRLGLAERSHLIEYSVLAIFIQRAFTERFSKQNLIIKPAIFAFVVSLLIGIFDECIQIFQPDRVFDPADILFNAIAISMAIGTTLFLTWVRNQLRKSKIGKN